MKNIKKINYLITIIILFVYININLNAENSYEFQESQSEYLEIKDGKVVSMDQFDPQLNMYFLDELKGETFQFYKIPFLFTGVKTFAIEPYSVIRIDNDSALIIIDAAFTYMDSIDENSSISYKIEGQSGDFIVKTQWKNLKLRLGQTNNFVNIQIWIYQKSGLIELRYGPRSDNNLSGYDVNTGPQVGMFFSRDNFTKCYEKLWVTGSPNNIKLDSANNYVFRAMSGIPSDGTVFSFKPRFIKTNVENDIISNIIKISPNPSNDEISISNFEMKNLTYSIVNLLGESVKTGNLTEINSIIDVSNILSGSYNLIVFDSGKIISNTKYIKN